MKKFLLIVVLMFTIGYGAANAETFTDWLKQKTDEVTKSITSPEPKITVPVPLTSSVPVPKGAPQSFADLAEQLLPSVVNISSTQKMEPQRAQPNMPNLQGNPFQGSPFEQLFKDFMDRNGMMPPLGEQNPQSGDEFGGDGGDQGQGEGMDPFGIPPASAMGSGFIIDAAKGYIVTNNHVIKDADEVRVTLHDDTTLDAKILGIDEKTDLALLQVEHHPSLKAVPFGKSDSMRVGDWVLAIGNPFGLGGTVTSGIISARQRNINAGPYDDFLQTDASINRGNSGGPMFNLKGEVIGINTAIFSPTGGSVGIGFAIPSDLAKPVIDQLIKYGKTRRGWLGVRIQSVTPEIAETLKLPDSHGALVASITKGGPAEKAGLVSGDVILEFNGQKLSATRQLPRLVAETEIGSMAVLKIWRDGKIIESKIEVGELEKAEEQGKLTLGDNQPPNAPMAEQGTNLKDLGITLSTLTPQLKEQFEIPANAKGVLVISVNPNSEGGLRGLTEGDIIVEINQAPVNDSKIAAKLITDSQKSGKSSILLLVDFQGQGDVRFVALRLKK
jgi:serine protease Do